MAEVGYNFSQHSNTQQAVCMQLLKDISMCIMKSKASIIVLSMLIAFCGAATIVLNFFNNINTSQDALCASAWLAILMTKPTMWLLRYIRSTVCYFSKSNNVLVCIISLAFGMLLVFAIPVKYNSCFELHKIEVVATGQKNDDSSSASVFVGRMYNDGIVVAEPSDYIHDGTWKVRPTGDYVVSDVNLTTSSKLYWTGRLDTRQEFRIQMVEGMFCGIVDIYVDGTKYTYDLGVESPPAGRLKNFYFTISNSAQATDLVFFICASVSLSFCILAMFCHALKYTHKCSYPQDENLAINHSDTCRGRKLNIYSPYVSVFCKIARYAFVPMMVWTIYLFLHWPGMLSNDSIEEWAATNGIFVDKPFFHQLIIYSISRLVPNPGAVIIFNFSIFALAIGWGVYTMEKLGASNRLKWITILFVSFSITYVRFATWLLNDVLFAAGMLALTIVIVKIVWTDGDWLKNNLINNLVTFLIVLETSLVRHNGTPVAFASLILLLFVFRKKIFKQLFLIFICALASFIFITGPVKKWLNVPSFPINTIQSLTGSLLLMPVANLIHNGVALTVHEQRVLDNLSPLRDGIWTRLNYANPVNFAYYKNSPTNNMELFDKETLYVLLGLEADNFIETISFYFKCNSFIWNISTGPNNIWPLLDNNGRFTRNNLPPPYSHSIENPPMVPFGPVWTARLFALSASPELAWFFWRSPIWYYFLVFSVVVASFKTRNLNTLLILMPVTLNNVALFIACNSPEFRYTFPTVAVSTIFSFVLFFSKIRSRFY